MTGRLAPTPGQTVGPFFHHALVQGSSAELVPPGYPGRVRLHGLVLDGAGAPVPDALVEIYQVAAAGEVGRAQRLPGRDESTFSGWGRTATDRNGRYCFSTVAPAPTRPGAAAFVAVCVFARGLLDRLFTRVYLPGDDGALAEDRVLSSLAPERRSTLIADTDDAGYVFDIRLQGSGETVFLNHGGRPTRSR